MRLQFLTICTFFSLVVHAAPEKSFHLMIDPGHGGIDTGAVHGRLKEADLVLDVAERLRTLLQKENLQVSLTRTADLSVGLPERVKKAADAKVDLLLSLHANSAPDGRAQGLEFFFQNSMPADEDSLFLANLENRSLNETLPTREASPAETGRKGDVAAIVEDLHRQSRLQSSLRFTQILGSLWSGDKGRAPAIKQAPFYMVSHAAMPSVLVEVGFLTHAAEAKKLSQPSYRQTLASRLKDAVLVYKERLQNLTLKQETGRQVEFLNAPR